MGHRNGLTAGDLLSALKDLPADTPVVLHARDHSYRQVSWAGEADAEDEDGTLVESYETTPNTRRVFLIE